MDKLRTGQFIVDPENNQLTFLDVRYYYDPKTDNWFPSATTILDAYPKNAAFYEWLKKNGDQADEIRDAAGERGSIVHKLTEQYDNGDPVSIIDADGRIRYKQTEWSMFERYVDFSRRFKPRIVQTEFNLVSSNLGFGGTLDRIVEMDGKFYLLDIKTSGSVHNHYWLQASAYVKLYQEFFPEQHIDGICILWLNAKTRSEGKKGAVQGIGWQLVFPDKDIEYYWNLFKCTQALWVEENKDYKPRNLVYNLEHKTEAVLV